MTFRLSQLSRQRLQGVHQDLVRVVELAITLTPVDFRVTEGLRDKARQKILVAAGASQTLKSRHLTGHAIDVAAMVDGEVRWDWPLYDRIAVAMKAAAKQIGTPIEWGGDWKMRDGPHFQLPVKRYP